MVRAATERVVVRLRPEQRSEVERASALLHMTTSEFVREAVAARAEQVGGPPSTAGWPSTLGGRKPGGCRVPSSGTKATAWSSRTTAWLRMFW